MRRVFGHKVATTILVIVVLTIITSGIVSAAVAGEFSSSYDGYNDGADTDVRGHEIQVSGTFEFSGENAVTPLITVSPSQNTVLDDETVELTQSADSSIDFTRQNVGEGVRYRAEEIPAGSSFDLQFVVYPVANLDQSEIESASVTVRYERPGGEGERQTFGVTTGMNNSAPQVISDLEASQSDDDGNSTGGAPIWMQGLAGVGVLAIVVSLFMMTSGGDDI